jgi:hypothetical protein
MDNIFELIANYYTAVDDIHEADFMPTTMEVFNKLVSHTGLSALTLDAVFSFLEQTGYKQVDLGDLHIVWLMKSDFSVLSEP